LCDGFTFADLFLISGVAGSLGPKGEKGDRGVPGKEE